MLAAFHAEHTEPTAACLLYSDSYADKAAEQ